MSVNACADLVRRGDPDRFRAAMAAKPRTRAVLFPIYAFNLEIARAPWVTSEPLLAEMRLQWWRDALEEIAAGGRVRRHEVATPLSEAVDAEGARILGEVVDARRWEIENRPFSDQLEFYRHLTGTAGSLMWAAARSLGATDEDEVRGTGYAGGLAAWFVAVPALLARNREPLFDDSLRSIRGLAQDGLTHIHRVSRPARPAALAAWEARPILKAAIRDPRRVYEGRLERAPGIRNLRLARMALLGV